MALLKQQANVMQQERSVTEHRGLNYHFYQDRNSIFYILVTAKSFDETTASYFLNELQGQLYESSKELKSSPQEVQNLQLETRHIANELNGKLSELRGRRMEQFDIEQEETKTVAIQRTLNQVTGTMRNNITKIFENQEDLNEMDTKSGDIRDSANQFRLSSQRLEQQSKAKKLKMIMMAVAAIIVLFLVIYFLS